MTRPRKVPPRAPLTPEQQALASDPVVHRRAASLILIGA